MLPRFLSLSFGVFLFTSVFAQKKFTVVKDLRGSWMTYEAGSFKTLGDAPVKGLNTIYFQLEPRAYPNTFLKLASDRPYFLFINGKIRGEYQGQALLDVDSLARALYGSQYWIAVHQDKINERDLRTEIISGGSSVLASADNAPRPYSHFRDFVVLAGLLVILSFLVAMHLNRKLAEDYFSVSRIFSAREAEDSQSSARLTSSSNVQFYVLCSLTIGLYLLIILYHLPPKYALPTGFYASGFWMMWWQWLKLSSIIFLGLMLKLLLILSMTRLFGMRGMARFHFFNWMRLLLVAFGLATVVLFMYFISRGNSPDFFVALLLAGVAVLIAWIVLAFFKLSGRGGHSMFHLFSYLCATEIIPLLITIKVLFQ